MRETVVVDRGSANMLRSSCSKIRLSLEQVYPGGRDRGVSAGVKNAVSTTSSGPCRDDEQGVGHDRGGVVPHQGRGGRLPPRLLPYRRDGHARLRGCFGSGE